MRGNMLNDLSKNIGYPLLSDLQVFYSWHFKIDSTYEENDDWQIISQFHDQPDPASGETWDNYPAHSPPLAYKYKNGNLVISVPYIHGI